MNSIMNMVFVPLGYGEKVVKAAKDIGATGATILHARGANPNAKEGLFSFHVEPEEEIVLIIATKAVSKALCARIQAAFERDNERNGSVYLLPIELVGQGAVCKHFQRIDEI